MSCLLKKKTNLKILNANRSCVTILARIHALDAASVNCSVTALPAFMRCDALVHLLPIRAPIAHLLPIPTPLSTLCHETFQPRKLYRMLHIHSNRDVNRPRHAACVKTCMEIPRYIATRHRLSSPGQSSNFSRHPLHVIPFEDLQQACSSSLKRTLARKASPDHFNAKDRTNSECPPLLFAAYTPPRSNYNSGCTTKRA